MEGNKHSKSNSVKNIKSFVGKYKYLRKNKTKLKKKRKNRKELAFIEEEKIFQRKNAQDKYELAREPHKRY